MTLELSKINRLHYIADKFWDGINSVDIDSFLTNFNDTEKLAGLMLLDQLLYYSSDNVSQLAKYLLKMLKRKVWIDEYRSKNSVNSEALNKFFEREFWEQTVFIPINKPNQIQGSCYTVNEIYKKVCEPSNLFNSCSVSKLKRMLKKRKKYIVFIDDIIGTGERIRKFLTSVKHTNLFNKSIKELTEENSKIKFFCLTFGSYEPTFKSIQKEFPYINFLSSEIFTEDYSVFSEKSEFWEFEENKISQEQRTHIFKIWESDIERVGKNIYSLNLPILFQHCRAPNTTFELFWKDTSNWKPLLKR